MKPRSLHPRQAVVLQLLVLTCCHECTCRTAPRSPLCRHFPFHPHYAQTPNNTVTPFSAWPSVSTENGAGTGKRRAPQLLDHFLHPSLPPDLFPSSPWSIFSCHFYACLPSFIPSYHLSFLSSLFCSVLFFFPLTLTVPLYVSDIVKAAEDTFFNIFIVKVPLCFRGY